MDTGEVRVPWQPLKAFTKEVFVRAGMPADDAEIEADVLVWANLRGVDSHGVLRIPWYVELVDKGQMNPRPNIRILKETPATLLIDADHAFGPIVTIQAMRLVMQKAHEVGIGWGLIRNTTHQGALAYYSLIAARNDMAGIALVCSPPNMAPYGARAAGVHNSPISIAVPARRYAPLVLDFATSIAAGGKLRLAQDKGTPIPLGWALDKDGNPTKDANKASILLPFAGPKGSGLAVMFECLSSLMADNPLLEPTLLGLEKERRHRQNGIVAAVNIGFFTDLEKYKENVDTLIEELKALPRADGIQEILVPGELEEQTHGERSLTGIPLPAGTIRKLRSVAERFGMGMPQGL